MPKPKYVASIIRRLADESHHLARAIDPKSGKSIEPQLTDEEYEVVRKLDLDTMRVTLIGAAETVEAILEPARSTDRNTYRAILRLQYLAILKIVMAYATMHPHLPDLDGEVLVVFMLEEEDFDDIARLKECIENTLTLDIDPQQPVFH